MRNSNHMQLRISLGISPKEIQDEKGSVLHSSDCFTYDVRPCATKTHLQVAGDSWRRPVAHADLPASLRAVNFGGHHA